MDRDRDGIRKRTSRRSVTSKPRKGYTKVDADTAASQNGTTALVVLTCIVLAMAAVAVGLAVTDYIQNHKDGADSDSSISLSASAAASSDAANVGVCAEVPRYAKGPMEPARPSLLWSRTKRNYIILGAEYGAGLVLADMISEASTDAGRPTGGKNALVWGCGPAAATNDYYDETRWSSSFWTYMQCDYDDDASMIAFFDHVYNVTGKGFEKVVLDITTPSIGRSIEAEWDRVYDSSLRNIVRQTRITEILQDYMQGVDDSTIHYFYPVDAYIFQPNMGTYSADARAALTTHKTYNSDHGNKVRPDGIPSYTGPRVDYWVFGYARSIRGNVFAGSDLIDYDPLLEDAVSNRTKCMATLLAEHPDRQHFGEIQSDGFMRGRVYHKIIGGTSLLGGGLREMIEFGGPNATIPLLGDRVRDVFDDFLLGDFDLRIGYMKRMALAQRQVYEHVREQIGPAQWPAFRDCCVCARSDPTGPCSSVLPVTCSATFNGGGSVTTFRTFERYAAPLVAAAEAELSFTAPPTGHGGGGHHSH